MNESGGRKGWVWKCREVMFGDGEKWGEGEIGRGKGGWSVRWREWGGDGGRLGNCIE